MKASGQSTLEYIIMLAAVVAAIIFIARPSGLQSRINAAYAHLQGQLHSVAYEPPQQ